ncbi:hypothetical protein [Cerasicoccus arenae]|uniref:Uncharacterized protein n=1 Tax=Cerasicoccus arenae TaxID=424488 RepID=A0A8J3DHJ1_9BACT|nr:hypothetical protein [Cerasicoccus arenae]MBK1857402.1 hypothetical protein [Cerasicoccus arenae]GHC07941.1 hypothetical protein GCM10007047_26470 [Cerasicoccus arenae]
MLKRLILASLVVLLGVCISHADLENFVVDKRAIYYQTEPSIALVPAYGAYLDYYFDLVGNPNLYSASFSANLHEEPIQFKDDYQWRGYRAFSTLTNLKSTYPNTQFYDFTTWLFAQGNKVSQGIFSSPANFPDYAPVINNYNNAQSIFATSKFTFSMQRSASGFAGSGFVNYIQLTLFDPVTLNIIYDGLYDKYDQLLDVPGNTLSSNRNYFARIRYISPSALNPASNFSEYAVLSRYLRETWLRISTTGSAPSLVPTLSRSYHWAQESADNLFATPDENVITVKIPRPALDDLGQATLSRLDIRQTFELPDNDDPDYAFALDLTGDDLDSGLFSVGWQWNSGVTRAEIANCDWPAPAIGPEILNWEACQEIAPMVDFTVSVQQPDNAPNDLNATLEFRDLDDVLVATVESTVNANDGIIEVIIPGNTLNGSQDFIAKLILEPNAIPTVGIDQKVINIVEFPIATDMAIWPGVKSAGLYRGYYFDNETGEPDTSIRASFSAIITEDIAGDIDSASIERQITSIIVPKASGEYQLSRVPVIADEFRLSRYFTSESAMLDDYPNAVYQLKTIIDTEQSQANIALQDLPNSVPTIQVNTNYFQDGLDPSLPIAINWTGIDASGDNVTVEVRVNSQTPSASENEVDVIRLENIAADGLSGFIPANILPANTEFNIYIVFRRNLQVNSTQFADAEIILGDEHFTNATLTTSSANYHNWLANFLNEEQLNDPAYTLPTANPDGDPFNNIQEYALNFNPLTPSTPPQINDVGSSYLYEFNWRSDNPLLNYEVVYSITLIPPFTPYDGTPSIISGNPYSLVRLTFPGSTRLFIQLILNYGTAE